MYKIASKLMRPLLRLRHFNPFNDADQVSHEEKYLIAKEKVKILHAQLAELKKKRRLSYRGNMEINCLIQSILEAQARLTKIKNERWKTEEEPMWSEVAQAAKDVLDDATYRQVWTAAYVLAAKRRKQMERDRRADPTNQT